MPQRRQHTTRKHIRLTRGSQEAIQSWADGSGISFSAALESLARIGLGQPIDEALAPALVSVVRVEVQRQMHRLASLLAANAIEAGVSARMSGAALRALRPKDYDAIKRATESTPFIRSGAATRSWSSANRRTPMAILKANCLPQAQSGRISRSVAYYTWREGADQQPRPWHDQDGRELGYDAAKEEVGEHAPEASYTYRIVLSTRDAQPDHDQYSAVLNEHFDDFYLTTHHAGEHPHAHAIAFSDHRLSAGELREMREHLHELEIEREQQLELDPMNERSF